MCGLQIATAREHEGVYGGEGALAALAFLVGAEIVTELVVLFSWEKMAGCFVFSS